MVGAVQATDGGILDVAGSLVVEYKHGAWGKPTLVRTLTTAYKAMAKLDPLSIVGVHDEGTGSYSPGSRFYDPLAIIYRGKLRGPEAFAPGVPIEVVKYVWKRQGTLDPCTIESCVFMNVPMFQREEKKMQLQKSILDYLEDLDVSESSHEAQEEAVRILTSYVATSIPSIQFLIRPFAWKDVWDNAARIIVAQTDAALERYIPQLLIWLTDINWPGADLIFKRLIQFSGEKLEAWIDDAPSGGQNGWEPLLGREFGRPAYKTSGKKRLDRSLYPVPIQTYSEENRAQENTFDCSSLVPAPAPRRQAPEVRRQRRRATRRSTTTILSCSDPRPRSDRQELRRASASTWQTARRPAIPLHGLRHQPLKQDHPCDDGGLVHADRPRPRHEVRRVYQRLPGKRAYLLKQRVEQDGIPLA